MPSPRVITERPSEARDAPTFGARFVEKFLAETQIPYTGDVYLLCISRQFVFTWNVITRDVPAIGTYRFSLRLCFGVVAIQGRPQYNTDANQRCQWQHPLDKLCAFFRFVFHNYSRKYNLTETGHENLTADSRIRLFFTACPTTLNARYAKVSKREQLPARRLRGVRLSFARTNYAYESFQFR